MTEIAGAAGVTREASYKALRPDAPPRFDTIQRVCTALGLERVARPLTPATDNERHADQQRSRVGKPDDVQARPDGRAADG